MLIVVGLLAVALALRARACVLVAWLALMGRRRRTSDGRRGGLYLRQLCALALPVVLPCVVEVDIEGDSCTSVVQSLSVEVESSAYCDALCGDSSCAAISCHDHPSPRHPYAPRPLIVPDWRRAVATRRFDRGACLSKEANADRVAGVIEAAQVYNDGLAAEIDSFEQVGGADRACRARPKREADTNYYDRYYTEIIREAAMYQHRERCEFFCATDDECVAYEFQQLGVNNSGVMQGVCEKWRVGPVFESDTNGPTRAGATEDTATGFSCWMRARGGKVKSTSISGCPMSIVSLGLHSLAISSAILVVVCCICQTQKQRVGNVTIDQSAIVADLSVPVSQMTPDHIRALHAERAALEAALGVSPESGNGEQVAGAHIDLQSRLDAAADAQSSDQSADEVRPAAVQADEMLPSAPPGADVAFTAAPPAVPQPPLSARPPASPRPM